MHDSLLHPFPAHEVLEVRRGSSKNWSPLASTKSTLAKLPPLPPGFRSTSESKEKHLQSVVYKIGD